MRLSSGVAALLALLGLATLAHATPSAAPGAFSGIVVERATGAPIPGVTVAVPELGLQTETDFTGRFRLLGIPPGLHRVTVRAPELVPIDAEEPLRPGQTRTVRYRAEPRSTGIDEERVIRAPRIRRPAVVTVVPTREARRVPGTQGDALKVVEDLPGVARAPLGSGQIVVWGAAPEDTRVVVDGVELPALYHIGGLRSTVNSDLVRSVDLLPGAYGAEYGRGLGGVVRVGTRELPGPGVHGYVGADLLDASALLSAQIGKRLRIAAAGRYGYLDRILGGALSPTAAQLFPVPRYDDYQFKATVALRRDEELSAVLLASDDHLSRSDPTADPNRARTALTDSSFYRAYLRYTRLLPDGSSLQATPFFGYDESRELDAFGAVPAQLSVSAQRYGLRASYRTRLVSRLTLSLGVDLLGTRSHMVRFGSLTLPAREGDITVFGQPPGDDVNADDWTATQVDIGPYAFVELRLGRLTITPGLRLDGWATEASRLTPPVAAVAPIGYQNLDWTLDPRLQLDYRASRRVRLTAAGGIYHQAPAPEDLSAVFGNPTLGLERALAVSAGVHVRIIGTLFAEATGYFKYLDSLVARSPAPTPPRAGALTEDGIGWIYGGQVMLRQELFRGLFGWLSYSISRSQRQDYVGAPLRLFDDDQTHVLTLVASYEWRGFSAGTRLRYATGMPRTPVVGAFYDARDDAYQPELGAQNSDRLPDFFQLDLRLEKRFVLPHVGLDVYLDVENVTYRKNPEEIVYNYNFTSHSYISGIPTLAVLGAKVEF